MIRPVAVSASQATRLQRNAADPAKARRGKAKRHKTECRNCDGCGWYEGGKTIQTTCEKCAGKGWTWEDAAIADATREREHVQPAIEDYLRAEGLVPIPINSGAATIIGGRACLKGVPDLVTWVPMGRIFHLIGEAYQSAHDMARETNWAIPCFIEVKRPKGGRYSKEQLAFRDRAIADGCLWIGASCVEDLAAVIPPRGK